MRTHNSDSNECWCHPDLWQPCPECTSGPTTETEHFLRVDTVEPSDPNCWRCGGNPHPGLVPEYDVELPLIVVHHKED